MEQRIRTANQLTCDISQVSNADVALHHYITFDFDPKAICLLCLNDSLTKQFCDKKDCDGTNLLETEHILFHTLHCTIFGKQIIIVKFQRQHSTASRVSWGPTHSWGFRQGTRKLDCLRCLVLRLLSLLYWSDSGLDCRTMVWFCPNLLTSFGSLWCLWLICKVLKWWLRGSFQKRAAHSNTEERHVAQFEPMTSTGNFNRIGTCQRCPESKIHPNERIPNYS